MQFETLPAKYAQRLRKLLARQSTDLIPAAEIEAVIAEVEQLTQEHAGVRTAGDRRTAIIQGLRELADWLEAHPDVPAATTVDAMPYLPFEDDEGGRAEVHRLVELTDADLVRHDDRVEAVRRFGPSYLGRQWVSWRALYIDRESMAEHRAMVSYSGSVRPDGAS